MAKSKTDEYEGFDDFESSYGPDSDLELFDDTAVGEARAGDCSLAAWQRIEMQQESKWLRSQVVDWDEWDEYLERH